MASKRKLKKEIITLVASLFDEALLIRAFAPKEQVAELEAIMDDIMIFTDDTLRRVAHPDGKDNPKIVKAHYKKIVADIEAKAQLFDALLTQQVEKL